VNKRTTLDSQLPKRFRCQANRPCDALERATGTPLKKGRSMPQNSRKDFVVPPNIDVVGQLLVDSLAEGDDPVVKRIDEATIQLCKLAARGKGMKINRWVADALSRAAQNQFGHSPDQSQSFDVSALLDRISRLEGEVSALSKSHAAIVTAVVSR
jgi:hypothetical protein